MFEERDVFEGRGVFEGMYLDLALCLTEGLSQQLLHPDERKRLQSVKRVKELQSFVDLNWADVEKGEATPPFIPPVCLYVAVTVLCVCVCVCV